MNVPDPLRCRRRLILLVIQMFLAPGLLQAAGPELQPPGFRPVPPGVHALVGARVVVKPGETLDSATIVMRDGIIQSVGKDTPAPPDARVWDMKGLTVYAGFIEPYLVSGGKEAGESAPKEPDGLTGGGVRFFGVEGIANPGPGYEVARVTPQTRISQRPRLDAKMQGELRELGFTTANLSPELGIIRGISALVALGDEGANRSVIKPEVFQNVSFDLSGPRDGGYPGSLMGAVSVVRQSFFDAQHYLLDQADFERHPQGRTRPAYNPALEALSTAVNRKMPVVFEPGDALMVDAAARIAREAKLEFYLLSCGQEWRRPELAKAAGAPFIVPLNFPIAPKLAEDDDWEQVTLDELRAWDWAPENPAVLRKAGIETALTTHGLEDRKEFRKNLRLAVDRGFSENDALAALTTVPARLCGLEYLLGAIQPGKIANLTIVEGKGYFDPGARVRGVWIDGRYYAAPPELEKHEAGDGAGPKKDTTAKDAAAKNEAGRNDSQSRVARPPLEGRGPVQSPGAVLIRHATIWTSGPAGNLTNADLLVVEGKIAAVGHDLAKEGIAGARETLVVDAAGLQVTPGLIDCHSHSMILGSVNEATLPSSAMVRVGDVVNSESPNIYDQLAGGVTVVNLLHGSANPIGGQNCVIKLRDGADAEGLKFRGAPPGIKFALGENVKQSNWGDRAVTRYPQTRMGVRTFIENRFVAARDYLGAWEAFRSQGGPPPRRDLELEALGEIIEGKRWIHCHSYRQDEILMLIRLMDDFGVKIATFQHVLEGYKVADEIARHGAGGSTFSDWWAYKFEVYDAIPYNGSLMRDRGVVVSFNSDSDDLARRLYLEAAKAVKYGGTPESEALKFVTLNPARQLRIDHRVGSLEPGKDADFAIWSKSPLDSTTVCLQTWIDGKLYFDKSLAPARTAALAKERADLLAKIKKAGTKSQPPGSGAPSAPKAGSFFIKSLEHIYDGVNRHCLDADAE